MKRPNLSAERVVNGGVADGGDASRSAFPTLEVPPSRDAVVAPVNVTDYIDSFQLLDARRFVAMHQGCDMLNCVDLRYGGKHDIALAAWKNRSLMFYNITAPFIRYVKVQLDMPYVRRLKKREYAARLSTLVVLLDFVSNLLPQVDVHTVLDRPYNMFPFFENLGRCGRNCDFELRVGTTHRPVLEGRHNAEIFQIPLCGRGSLYVPVSEWWSSY